MRVLIVNHSYTVGGAARYVRDLHNGLPAVGVEAEVWTADPPPGNPAGVHGVRRPFEKYLFPMELLPGLTDWRHRGSIAKFDKLDGRSFDVVHLNHVGGGWASVRALHRLCRRMPVVWIHHDEWAATDGFNYLLEGKLPRAEAIRTLGGYHRVLGISPYHHSFKSRSLGRLLDRWAPRPAVHICPSEYMAELVRRSPRFRGDEVAVVPHGTVFLDHPRVKMPREQARAELGIPPSARVILLVSANALDLHKGLPIGVRAAQAVHRETPVHLLVMGRGSEQLIGMARPVPVAAGLAVNDAESARAYRAADVTLIPSLGETFCYAAVESLACGTPFVSFRNGGPEEIADGERNGLLADGFAAEPLAKRLAELLADPAKREQLGVAGRDWVARHCRMETMLARTREVYEQAIHTFQKRA